VLPAQNKDSGYAETTHTMTTLLNGVSFLICTYNSVARIEETLCCLAQQQAVANAGWEVVLVDNACTDGTTAEAERCWQALGNPMPLRIFYEPRPGKNFAVELAFQQARYRYACIVDDDNRLSANYFKIGYDLLEANPMIGILGGMNTATFDVAPPEWFPVYQHCYAVGEQKGYKDGQIKTFTDGNIGRNALWGAGMYIRTSLWHQLQQLQFKSLFVGRQGAKNLTAGEDDEICYAIQMIGYEVWYSSKLQLRHHMTAGRLTKEYRNQLFYSSVWSQTRIFAYINTLWGNPSKFLITSNLLKDFVYMLKHLVVLIFSRNYFKALAKNDTFFLMNVSRQALITYAFIRDVPNIKYYYHTVMQFKNRIDAQVVKQHTSHDSIENKDK
jgi:glycosyltransferase involved in cell wall biosynthesis